MAITEESRSDLYQGLAKALGKQRATTLMEHLPQGGWSAMATKQDLEHAVVELRADMDVRFAEVRADFAEVRADLADLRTELHKSLRVHLIAMMAMTITLMGLLGGWSRLGP